MDPRLLRIVARERERDLRAAAAAEPRPSLPVADRSRHAAVTIRYAFPDDAQALERLAALDSSAVPDSPMLVVEVDGVLCAALSLADGAVIADPFRRTAGLVELMRTRSQQLREDRAGAHARWRWSRRLALRLAR